ncbi:DUF2513 domain-containing protein [uncultured Celeribacter sp.]|uniref:DUF2513 domain-containing protein n=1 Tax=uncultured Celeribacter sp. TaxID=1303376 RepID=UPI002AA8927E|nr:DUF2513 domain-containing protein [uncultured Celeribacter sp.]
MKRDFERIRELLMESEKSSDRFFEIDANVDDFDRYQISLMEQAGLVKILDPNRPPNPTAVNYGLARMLRCKSYEVTWQGHDYLDAIRSDTVWNKTKEGAAKVGGMTLGMMKDLAIAYVKQEAVEKLGIKL